MNEQPVNALPEGHRIEEYELVRVLRAGDFDVTYLASDRNLNAKVVLREYLPSEIATRTADNSVAPQEDTFREDFEWGMERFLDQARTLAQFQHPNIVRVHRSFAAQGTAYMAMEYVEGETLSEVLARRATLSESALRDMLQPLLAGLAVVHEANLLHRDINPENIILRNEGDSPVLLDFGAARQAIGARIRPGTPVVTPGYAPPEQYSAQGEQGPWTDLYALGGVCYRALTGQTPADATDQSRQDPLTLLRGLCGDHVSASTLDAIGWALRENAQERPQDVAAWRANFLGEAEAPAAERVEPEGDASAPADAGEPASAPPSGSIRLDRRKMLIWGGLVALVVLVGVGGYWGMRGKAEQPQLVAESAGQAASEEERAAEAARDVASGEERAAAAVVEERQAESSGQVALAGEREAEVARQAALEQERAAESSGQVALAGEREAESARQAALERERQAEATRQATLDQERAAAAVLVEKHQAESSDPAESARQTALAGEREAAVVLVEERPAESSGESALVGEREAEPSGPAALEQEGQAALERQAALDREREAEAARQAALERQRQAVAARQVGASMEFVWIRPGSFKMGSPSSERGCDDESRHCEDEGPVHEVKISQGFWLGKYEVTQGQWKAVMGRNPSEFQGDDRRPVERVSWQDVHAFIGRLNDAAGDLLYRLPSEAEWEYACRAGSSGRWAGRGLGDYAWYRKNSNYSTQAVGGKSPNRWGLHDMHGNVAEWVQDWYDEDYYASSPRVDPRGPASGSYRVLRGGHFISSAEYVRSALRYHTPPSNNDGHFGVRLVKIR